MAEVEQSGRSAWPPIGAVVVILGAAFAAGCSSGHSSRLDWSAPAAPPTAQSRSQAMDAPRAQPSRRSARHNSSQCRTKRQRRVVGKPYDQNGRWFVPRHEPDYDRVGQAAWYGPGFQKNTTANGEIFDMHALSAAHPTLPLPSTVEVTNLRNGRSLKLRVNDRGPFNKGRIIDVSRRAARALGFERDGLTQVRVRYLGPAPLKMIKVCQRRSVHAGRAW